MRARSFLLVVVSVVLPPATSLRCQVADADRLADGTRWCFLGDEMTQRGSHTMWITLYGLTRFPDRSIETFNAGLFEDTAAVALKRFTWDVAPTRPTVVSVLFGSNDVDPSLYAQAPGDGEVTARRQARMIEYRESLRELVGRIRAIGAKPLLVTPPIYDEVARIPERAALVGMESALADCARTVLEVAAETGADSIDLHSPMSRMNRERQKIEPAASVIGPDRRFPGPAGQMVMAWLLLKASGATPEVASLSIDLKSGRFVAANSNVERVTRSDQELTFVWTARALPLPMDMEALRALTWAPVIDDLSREILQVIDLRSGVWLLTIDGARIGEFSSEQLSRGINLGAEPQTPQYKQARDVMRLVETRHRLIADNLRAVSFVEHHCAPDITHPVTLEQMKPILASRGVGVPGQEVEHLAFELYEQRKPREMASAAAAARLLAQARRAAQPQSHLYVLRAVR